MDPVPARWKCILPESPGFAPAVVLLRAARRLLGEDARVEAVRDACVPADLTPLRHEASLAVLLVAGGTLAGAPRGEGVAREDVLQQPDTNHHQSFHVFQACSCLLLSTIPLTMSS